MNQTIAPKVDICGTGISNLTLPETMDLFDNAITKSNKIRVCVTPVNCIIWASQNDYLKEIYNSADLTLCDGVPIIWASSLLGDKIKGRVTGLDLLPQCIERCHIKGFSMYFLGAKDGIAKLLKEKYEALLPGIQVKGFYSPPFAEKFEAAENEKMIALINEVKPDILWVSLTAPKQDYWIYEHFDKLDAKIIIGVGGAFEVAAGIIERAPVFMQKNGLEWLYRLIKEPGRLYKRYLVEGPKFIPILIKQWFRQRNRPK